MLVTKEDPVSPSTNGPGRPTIANFLYTTYEASTTWTPLTTRCRSGGNLSDWTFSMWPQSYNEGRRMRAMTEEADRRGLMPPPTGLPALEARNRAFRGGGGGGGGGGRGCPCGLQLFLCISILSYLYSKFFLAMSFLSHSNLGIAAVSLELIDVIDTSHVFNVRP